MPARKGDEAIWWNQQFEFYDEQGRRVMMTGADIVDTASQLGYVYDDDPPTEPATFGEELDLTVRAPGLTPPSPHEQATVPTPKAVLDQVRAAAAKEQPLSRSVIVDSRPESIGKPLPHRLPSHAGTRASQSQPGRVLAELVAAREKAIRRAIWVAVIAVCALVAIAVLSLR